MRSILTRLGVLVAVLGFSASVTAQDDPNYVLSVGSGVSLQGGTVTLPVVLDSTGDDIQGWSFGICLDENDVVVQGISLGNTTQTVKFGDPPDFEQVNIEPGGWTMGVVICFTACAVLPPGLDYELAEATYSPLAPEGTNIPLCPCSTVGTPVINTVVVVNGVSVQPVKNCGNIAVLGLTEFVRADTNADGFLDLSDGIWILNYLFQNGPILPCFAANDANGDGSLDTADAIFIVFFYFADGSPPPAPYPTCGTQPNQSLADCEAFSPCP